ncbi:hypothetical protein BpHYR1_028963 [Brachionus plicatilis]|uniref:Secreted protein n=1 Tax=Brachionus plicatilis TaxID=10195 RepID=A0A3M7SFT0_BRAPC|nr:hypothetical protein BpHYR1_028963 [Brachionus plicatilis]
MLLVPLLLKLPAVFVVRAVVHKFATVAKTTKTSFLVVLADIWLIVPSDRGSEVGGRPNGAFGAHNAA